MAFPCVECDLFFDTIDSCTHHRVMKHLEMFPREREVCIFCDTDVPNYFTLFDHVKESHPAQFIFLLQMGDLINRRFAALPKSPIFWMQVVSVREHEVPRGKNSYNKAIVKMWSRMHLLRVRTERNEAPTPPALTHLTTPGVEASSDEVHVSSVDEPSTSGIHAMSDVSDQPQDGMLNISSTAQEGSSNSSFYSPSLLFRNTIDLGNGLSAFTATIPHLRHDESTEERFVRDKLPTSSRNHSSEVVAVDDEDLQVIAHIKPAVSEPSTLISHPVCEPFSNTNFTTAQLAALLFRPIIDSDSTQESLQAMLEMQMERADDRNGVITDEAAIIQTPIAASFSNEDSGCNSKIINSIDSVISQVRSGMIPANCLTPFTNSVSNPFEDIMHVPNGDSLFDHSASILSGIGNSLMDTVPAPCAIETAQVQGEPTDSLNQQFPISNVPSAADLILTSTTSDRASGNIAGEIDNGAGGSSESDGAVFKVPMLPHQTTKTTSQSYSRKRKQPIEATQSKKISLGDLAKVMASGDAQAVGRFMQRQTTKQPKSREQSNNTRLAIIMTTLLGIDNRRDRQLCMQLEKQFTDHIGSLDHSLPESNDELRRQLILAFAVLRKVLDAPLVFPEPVVSPQDMLKAFHVAGVLWVFLPDLPGQSILNLKALSRLADNIALMMAQGDNVRAQLLRLSELLQAHVEPFSMSCLARFHLQMNTDIANMCAAVTAAAAATAMPVAVSQSTCSPTIVAAAAPIEPPPRVMTPRTPYSSPVDSPSPPMAESVTEVNEASMVLVTADQSAANCAAISSKCTGKKQIAGDDKDKAITSTITPTASIPPADVQFEFSSSSNGNITTENSNKNCSSIATKASHNSSTVSKTHVLRPFASEQEAKKLYSEDKRIWLNTEGPISCRYGCKMSATTSGMVSHYRRYHYDVYYQAAAKMWEGNPLRRWLAIRFGNVQGKSGSKEKRACVVCEGKADYGDRMHLAEHFKQTHALYFRSIREDYIKIFGEVTHGDPVIEFLMKR